MLGLADQEMGATFNAMELLSRSEGRRPQGNIAGQDICVGGEFDIEDWHTGTRDTVRPMRAAFERPLAEP